MGLNTSSAVSGFFPTQELVSLIFHGTPRFLPYSAATLKHVRMKQRSKNIIIVINTRILGRRGKSTIWQEIHNESSGIRFTRENQIQLASKT